MATTAELVARLYIAYFNRAPDPIGLQHWVDDLNAGGTLAQAADDFAGSTEAKETYPYLLAPSLLNAEDFINQVYQNVLARDADADGLKYYSDMLKDGKSAGAVVLDILNNAVTNPNNDDALRLQNKVDVGLYWANEAAANQDQTYSDAEGHLTPSALASAQGVIDGVDQTSASVAEAKAEADTFFATGQTFILTPEADEIPGLIGSKGTTDNSHNDTILAGTVNINGNGVENTLGSADKIDGGDGIDKLIVTDAVGTDITPNMKSVEILEVQAIGNGTTHLNLINTVDVEKVAVVRSTQEVWLENLRTNVSVSLEDSNENNPVDVYIDYKTGAQTEQAIDVSANEFWGSLNLGNTGKTLDTLDLHLANNVYLELNSDTDIKNIVADGSGKEVELWGDALETAQKIDLSAVNIAADGYTSVWINGNQEDVTYTGTNGDDEVYANAEDLNGKDSFDGGSNGHDMFGVDFDGPIHLGTKAATALDKDVLAAMNASKGFELLDIYFTDGANDGGELNAAAFTSIKDFGFADHDDGQIDNDLDVTGVTGANHFYLYDVVNNTASFTGNAAGETLNLEIRGDVNTLEAHSLAQANVAINNVYNTDNFDIGTLVADKGTHVSFTGSAETFSLWGVEGTGVTVDVTGFTATSDTDYPVYLDDGDGSNSFILGPSNASAWGGWGADTFTTGDGKAEFVYTSNYDSSFWGVQHTEAPPVDSQFATLSNTPNVNQETLTFAPDDRDGPNDSFKVDVTVNGEMHTIEVNETTNPGLDFTNAPAVASATAAAINAAFGFGVASAAAGVVTVQSEHAITLTGTYDVVDDDPVNAPEVTQVKSSIVMDNDLIDNNNEGLTIQFTFQGTQYTVTTDLSSGGINVTSASQIATAVSAQINAVTGLSTVASGGSVVFTGTDKVVVDNVATSGSVGPVVVLGAHTSPTSSDTLTVTFDSHAHDDNGDSVTFSLKVGGITQAFTIDANAVDFANPNSIATAAANAVNAAFGAGTATATGDHIDVKGGVALSNASVHDITAAPISATSANGVDVGQVTTLQLSGIVHENNVYTVTITGDDGVGHVAEYVAGAGDGLQQVENGLIAAINGIGGYTAANDGLNAAGVFTITDNNPGNGGFSLNAEVGATDTSNPVDLLTDANLPIDVINGFDTSTDTFDFSALFNDGAADTIFNVTINSSTQEALDTAFASAINLLGGFVPGSSEFAVVTVNGGGGAGTYLVADANHDGVFSAQDDMAIKLVGLTGTIDEHNFVLA